MEKLNANTKGRNTFYKRNFQFRGAAFESNFDTNTNKYCGPKQKYIFVC